MVRLFLTPNFSLVNTFMQCTPWVSVKVTPERDIVHVGLIQRIFTLGLCLLFWKTLLPLSIGFAVWYQIREARNEQIQDEIEHIENRPDLLGLTKLLPETANYLAARRHIPEELLFTHLPCGNVSLAENEILRKVFVKLSKEEQSRIANSSPINLIWALDLDPTCVKNLKFNPFDINSSDVAAIAFEKLPMKDFIACVANSNIPPDFLEDPQSCLVRAIATCEDSERLQAFAAKYPEQTLRILPQNKWDTLDDENNISVKNAKATVRWELDNARMNTLKLALAKGPVEIGEQDSHLIETLYRRCNANEIQNLLKSIAWNLEALNKLPVYDDDIGPNCFDFSFVDVAWFEKIFPNLEHTVRQEILFSRHNSKYVNRDPILEHAPLESWKKFAVVHNPVQCPEGPRTPRKMIQCLLSHFETNPVESEDLIRHISLQHFQKIFSQCADPFRLMQVVSGQVFKAQWLIKRYALDPAQCAELLFSRGAQSETILAIANGLPCKDELLAAFYLKSPIQNIEALDGLNKSAVITEEKLAEVPGKGGIRDYLTRLQAQKRQVLYKRLVNPKTSEEAITELERWAEGATVRQAQNIGMDMARKFVEVTANIVVEGLTGTTTPSSQSELGSVVSNFLIKDRTATSSQAMINLLLSVCHEDEVSALCTIAPPPVLCYLALKPEAFDFSGYITKESTENLAENDLMQIAKLFCEKEKYVELLVLVKQVGMNKLNLASYEKTALYKALSLENFKSIAHLFTDNDMRLVIDHCSEEKVQALFALRPEESLEIGGVSLAAKVSETETWDSLDVKTLLAHLPLATVLGEPITEERLQEVLRTCPDNISEEQLGAFICAGATSEDVARFISDKPNYVHIYVKHIYSLNPVHLWIVVEKSSDDMLAQLDTFRKPENFPMPKNPDQWHCALKVNSFKEALVRLVSNWKASCPNEYKTQIQQLKEEDREAMRNVLKKSNYYGKQYVITDFEKDATLSASPPSSPVTPDANQAHRVAGTFFNFASPSTTPADTQPPHRLHSPTIAQLLKTPLPQDSPLQQLVTGKVTNPIKPMPDFLSDEERLAYQVIKESLTFAEAQERHPDFFKDLPSRQCADQFQSAVADPFYLGELCLKVEFESFKKIVAAFDSGRQQEIYFFLAEQEHHLPPDDPKLRYFAGLFRKRSSVQHRAPPQATTGVRPPYLPNGTDKIYG